MRQLSFILTLLLTFTLEAQSIRDLYQEGLKAYEIKDFELFKQKMFTIDTMRPNYPAVVYNLAGAYSLTGELGKSIETLNKYILMDATKDFTKDADFDALNDLKEFKHILEKQEKLRTEIQINESFLWPVQASHPESITYFKKEKAYFIGGVRDGNIWKIEDGESPQLWAPTSVDSWSVMGLEISKDNKFLWVCTASMENFEGYLQEDQGISSVLKYNLKTGKCESTYKLSGGHIFGDLVCDSNGKVFVSDGLANKLYTVNEKSNELELYLDLSSTILNLQGLALNDDETSLYVSDYIDGIYKIDLETKRLNKLQIKSTDILLKGIDGLYFKNNFLIGLHNGHSPNRVIKYVLDKDGNAIIEKEVISQAGILGEPTQGVFVNSEFLYIANSPWAAYDKEGNFNPENNQLIIGKYK